MSFWIKSVHFQQKGFENELVFNAQQRHMNFINNQAFCKSVFSIEDDCKLVRLFPQEKKEITFMKDLIG